MSSCVREVRLQSGDKNTPQSTAAQQVQAPTPLALLSLPKMQCKVVDWALSTEVKMRRKQLVWMSPLNPNPHPHPSTQSFLKMYLFPHLNSPGVKTSSVPKGKKETETVLCVEDEKLYCDASCCHGYRNRTAVPLCLCAGKGKPAAGTDSP